MTINGTTYTQLSFLQTTHSFNSDNFATIGGSVGKFELDYFGYIPDAIRPIYYGGSGDGYATDLAAANASPLPVTWLEFTGEQIKERVKLNWQTSSE